MDDVLKRAYDTIALLHKGIDDSHYTVYGYVYDHTRWDSITIQSCSCFGELRNNHLHRREGMKYVCFVPNILYGKRRSKAIPNPDECQQFLTWLTNDSGYAPVFVNKNEEDYMSTGLIANASTPANYLIGGFEAARAIQDNCEQVITWCALVNKGVQPDLAYLVSYFLAYDRNKDTFYNLLYGRHDGHMPISVRFMDNAMLKNFLEHKVRWLSGQGSAGIGKTVPFYKDTDYNGVFAVWGYDAWFNQTYRDNAICNYSKIKRSTSLFVCSGKTSKVVDMGFGSVVDVLGWDKSETPDLIKQIEAMGKEIMNG